MAAQVTTAKKSDMKPGRKIAIGALVIKRSTKPKEDSEAAIRLEVDELSKRLKIVSPKMDRIGEKQATEAQDKALRDAGKIDGEIEALQRQIAALAVKRSLLLAPVFKDLDESGKRAIYGSTHKCVRQAYEACITVKLAGYTPKFAELSKEDLKRA